MSVEMTSISPENTAPLRNDDVEIGDAQILTSRSALYRDSSLNTSYTAALSDTTSSASAGLSTKTIIIIVAVIGLTAAAALAIGLGVGLSAGKCCFRQQPTHKM